jgi:NAD+ synthase
MAGRNKFTKEILLIDPEQEIKKIIESVRNALAKQIKRRGIVLGLSGGIDSSVTAAIAVKAVGQNRTLSLLMPEQQSSDKTLELSKMVADHFSIEKLHEDITGVLESVGFYKKYEAAVRLVIPEYGKGWKSKVVLPNIINNKGYNLLSIVAQKPDNTMVKKRLTLQSYLEIVAATNFKQRIRKMLEYYHADRLNYAVAGTPNRLEYDQGFFVKIGDGAADIKPIAHLYKTQVYQLAEYLGVPDEIRKRPPTTDTYSLAQGQDEFYFSLPYDKMDLCLYGKNNNFSAEEVSEAVGLNAEQVKTVFGEIDQRRSVTRYLHLLPLLADEVSEIRNKN